MEKKHQHKNYIDSHKYDKIISNSNHKNYKTNNSLEDIEQNNFSQNDLPRTQKEINNNSKQNNRIEIINNLSNKKNSEENNLQINLHALSKYEYIFM